MKLVWTIDACEDYVYWQTQDRKVYWQTQDRKTLRRINLLIKDILRGDDGKGGLGKPELLKGDLTGFASRRIDQEHRLVYRLTEAAVEIVACRYHYDV